MDAAPDTLMETAAERDLGPRETLAGAGAPSSGTHAADVHSIGAILFELPTRMTAC
jgi:hypothetical protein